VEEGPTARLDVCKREPDLGGVRTKKDTAGVDVDMELKRVLVRTG
jgi:hypothetical protein